MLSLLLLLLLLSLSPSPVRATVTVISRATGAKVAEFRDAAASFGRGLPDLGLKVSRGRGEG